MGSDHHFVTAALKPKLCKTRFSQNGHQHRHPPVKEEIRAAIKSLKNRKSSGRDNLSAELFKAEPQLAADLLQLLFTGIWEGKKLPGDWSEVVIVKIPKKGALSNCNNW